MTFSTKITIVKISLLHRYTCVLFANHFSCIALTLLCVLHVLTTIDNKCSNVRYTNHWSNDSSHYQHWNKQCLHHCNKNEASFAPMLSNCIHHMKWWHTWAFVMQMSALHHSSYICTIHTWCKNWNSVCFTHKMNAQFQQCTILEEHRTRWSFSLMSLICR